MSDLARSLLPQPFVVFFVIPSVLYGFSSLQETTAGPAQLSRIPPTTSPEAENVALASHINNFLEGGSIADRLTDLEDQIKGAKTDLKGKVGVGHSHATMKIHGRVHIDWWGFPNTSPGINYLEYANPSVPPQSRLQFRRLRFGVRGTVDPNMDYRIEMEFKNPSRLEFKDAWLGFKHLPVMQTVLMGNQKRPYGLDHLNSSRYNVFMGRPLIIEAFNGDSRRPGICAYSVSDNLAYNWRYGVFNGENIKSDGKYVNNHLQLQFAGRFGNTVWYDESSDGRGYAFWAISGTYAKTDGNGVPEPSISPSTAFFRTAAECQSHSKWYNTGVNPDARDYGLLGAEAVVNIGPIQWVAEYQTLWLGRNTESNIYLNGGYTYVAYMLTGEHMVWRRKSGTLGRLIPFENFFLVNRCRGGVGGGWGAWQVAARGSYANLNDEDIFGGLGKSITFGVNWYWSPHSRVQFNYIYGHLSDRDANNDPNNRQLESGTYNILGTRFMIDF